MAFAVVGIVNLMVNVEPFAGRDLLERDIWVGRRLALAPVRYGGVKRSTRKSRNGWVNRV